MSLSNASVPVGATYSPSGGSATSFVSMGSTLNTKKLYLDDSSELILRKTALVTVKEPTPLASAPNGYTQQRSTIVFHVPLALDNGEYTTNKVEISMSYDPETSASEVGFLRELIAHVGVDADFDGMFSGSIE